MCGRITQKSPPKQLGLGLILLIEQPYAPARYNGAPGQEQFVIRQNRKTGERTLDRLWWGFIPHWCKDRSLVQRRFRINRLTSARERRGPIPDR